MPLLAKSLAFAQWAHAGQTRKYLPEAYIEHCVRVSDLAANAGLSLEAQAAAHLHDVIEDTDNALSDLWLAGFPERVIDLVEALTKWWPDGDKRQAELAKPSYYARILSDPDATALKLLDRADNLDDMLRILPSSPRWCRNYLNKTAREFEPLYRACRNPFVRVRFRTSALAIAAVIMKQDGVFERPDLTFLTVH